MYTYQKKSVKTRLLALGLALLAISTACIHYTSRVFAGGPGTNYLVSQSALGVYPNDASQSSNGSAPVLSGNGRYVAFDSFANNLLANDSNGYSDVFVKDTQTNAVTLVSLLPSGAQFSNNTFVRDISYDGRYVLFGLWPADALYVRDTVNNITTPVFNSSGPCYTYAAGGGAISADGRYVTYSDSDYQGHSSQAVLKDMQTGACRVLSADTAGNAGNSNSISGGISCDGGIISFYTNASNLPGGSGGYIARFDTSGNLQLTKIAMEKSGSTVSCNGNVIASWNINGTAYELNRLTGQTTPLASYHDLQSDTQSVSLSDDGRFAAIVTNTDLDSSYPSTGAYNNYDTYVVDVKNNVKHLLSFTVLGNKSGSVAGAASISKDGSKVSYGYYTPSSTDTGHELISGLTTGSSSHQEDVYTSETGF